jgi:flagellar hook assembly protein FlgD
VSLEGTSPRTRSVDPTSISTGNNGQRELSDNPVLGSTSSVREAAAAAAGISFEAVRPNPARERAELVFSLAKSADVRVELYDGAGRLVREIASGARVAGEHRLMVDVSALSAGVYHCRLVAGGVEISRNVVVIR